MADQLLPSQSSTPGAEQPEVATGADGLGLEAIFLALWRSRWWIILASVLGAAAFGAYAFLATPVYRAEVKFTIKSSYGSASGMRAQAANQLGGLASLAGITVGGDSERGAALELLTSYGFLAEFVEQEKLLPVMFPKAVGKEPADEPQATLQDAVLTLQAGTIQVNDNKKSGIVTLAVEWTDPKLAANWANALLARANARLRNQAIADARRSRAFLEKEAERTAVSELRTAVYRLIESDMKSEVLASTQFDYAYRIVDPAYVSDPRRFVWPKRRLLVLAGLLLGGFLSVVFVGARSVLRPGAAHG